MTTEIIVKKCCECPFVDAFSLYEWSEYDCKFMPESLEKHSIHSVTGTKQVSYPSIKAGTIIPPKWCPLRKEKFTVELSQGMKDVEP